MRFQQTLRRELDQQTAKVSKAMSVPVILILTVISHLGSVLLSAKASLFPGYDAMMTVVTTCSQIIAGLYGITLAGYTFFLSRIDALTATDCTLDYVTGSIKRRFKYLILFLTGNVLMSLMASILLMYCPMPEGDNLGFVYRLICNEFILFAAFSIGLILYYSILVIDPNCIEKEAARLKRKLSGPISTPGSAAEFISLYDRIQQRCNAMLPESVLSQLHENKGRHFELTLDLLEEQKLLPKPMIAELNRIHRYYECVVNCRPLSVSAQMCRQAGTLLALLHQPAAKLPNKE